jgi:hypothetical protein
MFANQRVQCLRRSSQNLQEAAPPIIHSFSGICFNTFLSTLLESSNTVTTMSGTDDDESANQLFNNDTGAIIKGMGRMVVVAYREKMY